MTTDKTFLVILALILTGSAILAFKPENKRASGGLRLFTTSLAKGCRLANCWTCAGTCLGRCPTGNYYTQKTVGGKCKTIYNGLTTATN